MNKRAPTNRARQTTLPGVESKRQRVQAIIESGKADATPPQRRTRVVVKSSKTAKSPASKTARSPARSPASKTAKSSGSKTAKSPASKTAKSPASKTAKSPASGTQPANFMWVYAAAAACHNVVAKWAEGKRKGKPQWGDGDGVAEALVLAVHEGPAALGRLESLWKTTDKRHMPPSFQGFAEEADELFRRAGFDDDYSALEERKIVEVSPYFIHLQTDPKHPMYDRRCTFPPDKGLAASVGIAGEVVEVMQVTPFEDKDGVTRLYTGAGSRRTKATLLYNSQRLFSWFHQAAMATDKERKSLAPPTIIVRVQAKVYLPGKQRTLAAAISNQHRLGEDIVRESESAQALSLAGYSNEAIGQALGNKSPKTVSNLLSLNNLDRSLLDELAKGDLDVACAYRLAVEKSKQRQRAAAKATVAYKIGVRRKAAIEAWLAGEELPPVDGMRPLAQKRLLGAAQLLKKATLSDAERPYARLLEAIAGDEAALADLPDAIRKALGPPAKPDRELAKWLKDGFTAEDKAAWVAVGITRLWQAQQLRRLGVSPNMLTQLVSEDTIRKMAAEDADMLGDEDEQKREDDYFRKYVLPDPPTLGALYAESLLTQAELLAELGITRPDEGENGDEHDDAADTDDYDEDTADGDEDEDEDEDDPADEDVPAAVIPFFAGDKPHRDEDDADQGVDIEQSAETVSDQPVDDRQLGIPGSENS